MLDALRVKLSARGTLNILQPNYRYCFREYFDDYTHIAVYSHISLADFLTANGYQVLSVAPRFLPLTVKSRLPVSRWVDPGLSGIPDQIARQANADPRAAVAMSDQSARWPRWRTHFGPAFRAGGVRGRRLTLAVHFLLYLRCALTAVVFPFEVDHGEGIVWQQAMLIPGKLMRHHAVSVHRVLVSAAVPISRCTPPTR